VKEKKNLKKKKKSQGSTLFIFSKNFKILKNYFLKLWNFYHIFRLQLQTFLYTQIFFKGTSRAHIWLEPQIPGDELKVPFGSFRQCHDVLRSCLELQVVFNKNKLSEQK
jgi:hypothetical protein